MIHHHRVNIHPIQLPTIQFQIHYSIFAGLFIINSDYEELIQISADMWLIYSNPRQYMHAYFSFVYSYFYPYSKLNYLITIFTIFIFIRNTIGNG